MPFPLSHPPPIPHPLPIPIPICAPGSTHRRNQHPIAGLDGDVDALAVLIGVAGADGEHTRLAQLLDRALRQEDSRRSLDVGLDALHQDAVQQRRQRLDVAEGGGLVAGLAAEWWECEAGKRGRGGVYHCVLLWGGGLVVVIEL